MARATGFIIYKKITGCIEYLLLQTSYGIHHWTPPKGHVDPGESDLETAYRETVEEAGLLQQDLYVHEDMKCELRYEVNGKVKTSLYWLAKLKENETPVKLSDEHQDYKWVKLDEACELVHYKDMQVALQECQQYLEK